jgi:fructose/tagatose bisphosphate aldolase
MAIITGRDHVLGVYSWAQERGWVLPCFNSENLTTTESILAAAKEYGEKTGIPNLPIMIGITALYDERPQAVYYTHTRRWDTGLRLFMEELKVLAGYGGPYEDLQVLIHLDHILHETDSELLSWDLSQFSSIMYDASKLPFEENIKATARFVKEKGHLLMVEGACDEIMASSSSETSFLTTADKAEEYYRATGVDTIVANLGTEHRASTSVLKYNGDYARKIKERVGSKMVLHGGSSVNEKAMEHLAEDGICKVNVWTLLEREASAVLFEHMARNASKVANVTTVDRLQKEGVLAAQVTSGVSAGSGTAIEYFTTASRQHIVFQEMKRIIMDYLKLCYK